MKVIIKESNFNSPSKLDRLNAITLFIDIMLENSLYEPEELDSQAMTCYFVGFYDQQVSDMGITNFLRENYMNVLALDSIYSGLGEIGAIKHQSIFKEACEALNHLEEDAFASFIRTGDDNVEDAYREQIVPVANALDQMTREFNNLEEESEIISDLMYDFIGKMKNIHFVKNDTEFEDEIDHLIESVPDLEQRTRKAEQEAHEEMEGDEINNIIADVCTKFNLSLISIDEINYGDGLVSETQIKINETNNIVFCHFTAQEGQYYIMYNGSEATLVEKNGSTPKGSISIH
jgi:hypothetical protein